MRITKKEYAAILHELNERLIDFAHLRGEQELRKQFPLEQVEACVNALVDEVELEFRLEFVVGDFKQMLSRIRRKKEQVKGT